MKKYIFLFLILVLSTLSAQEDRPTAAILYFTAEEVLTQQQTKSLANHFSTALDSTKKVSMIAQSKVIGVLEKEGLDVSDCTTDACAVTIGGALGVSYVITGDVKKEGTPTPSQPRCFLWLRTLRREKKVLPILGC